MCVSFANFLSVITLCSANNVVSPVSKCLLWRRVIRKIAAFVGCVIALNALRLYVFKAFMMLRTWSYNGQLHENNKYNRFSHILSNSTNSYESDRILA